MDKTLEMAREAGFETMLRKGKILGFDRDDDYTEELKAFEALVRADEREACAKVFDDHWRETWTDAQAAEAIRTMGDAK